ncbi:Vesicle transport protein SFT2B [Vitis vinifera]|uniref:Vesicle transport protein n=1 Tax=Vitis vinifera TaxID=29760 RepID=A0A438KIM7_VITVI|nr:Vesicle transport protein SFT2B [Vitis vinifera]
MAGKLVLLSNWRWILVALKKSNLPIFVLSPVTVNACFLQSNQVRDNIHLWQFACTWEMLSWSVLYGSTAFLIGPKRQVTMMLDPVRIYATAIYLASIIIALFCALYVRNKLLTLLAIMLEFGALIWYSLSYIPFARSMVSKIMVSCFDTEF